MLVYLDYNSTSPVLPSVTERSRPFVGAEFGNPSSRVSEHGRRAKIALEEARKEVASLVSVSSDQIVFTGGGTESIFFGIVGTFRARPDKRHLIISAVEHSAVFETAEFLRDMCGIEITVLPVNEAGAIDLGTLEAAIRPDTALISCMLANNETGALFPVSEVASVARRHGVTSHTDAVQAVGKIPVDFRSLGVDLMSVSSHKLGALKGTGALVVGTHVSWKPVSKGGGQESGRRGGTENVLGAVAFGEAARCAESAIRLGEPARIAQLRDLFERELTALNGVRVSALGQSRLPGTSNLFFEGIFAQDLLERMAKRGVTASAGSACKAGSFEPSHVLRAMGLTVVEAMSAVRFSFGAGNDEHAIGYALDVVRDEVNALRAATAAELETLLHRVK